MSALDAALVYANRGWPVFPLHGIVNERCTCGHSECSSPGKHPLVHRGVHDASKNVAVIQGWWKRSRLANIGIATGEVSGIVVIDIDLPRALDSLDALVDRLPTTLTALTGGGGVHLLLRASKRHIRCTSARVPGIRCRLPGIDVRGDGGYIVAPPSLHLSGHRYVWFDAGQEVADAPAWLREPPLPTTPIGPAEPPRFAGDGTAYGLAVLRFELSRLANAKPGCRNHTLNRSAFVVAQLVAGGELHEAPARSALHSQALGSGLTEHETNLTLDSAFKAGMARPRRAPAR